MRSLYVIYDTLALESGPIFEAKNDSVAVRAYEQLTKDMPENQRSSFTLNYVGQFHDETMEFSGTYSRQVDLQLSKVFTAKELGDE